MSQPLILRIQELAVDGTAPITGALRLSKLAASKLDLVDFGAWIDQELGGYEGEPPEYRKLKGMPEVQNPVRGWQALQFDDQELYDMFRLAYVGEARMPPRSCPSPASSTFCV